MRKVGKYEKMRKNALLSSYITSILCLVLCVTMFFGTTAAWFTDTTTSQGNQIYVGTLAVDLNHATFSKGVQQKGNDIMDAVTENYQVFKTIDNGGIRWEPGYTAVEKFKVVEDKDKDNNLAFSYQMGIEYTFADGETAQKAIAEAITVWNYVGTKAEETVNLPDNFNELTALDVDGDGKADWERVDTLYNVITKHQPVFKGQMDKDKVTATRTEGEGENQTTVPVPAEAYHMIALHMDEVFADTTVQGQKLDDITIKLVATQLPSEEDAFGSNYDNLVYVETLEQLQAALDNAADGVTIVFTNDIEGNVVATQKENIKITIDGNGKTLAGVITVNGQSQRYETAALAIKNVNFKADSLDDGADACVRLGRPNDSASRNTNHVTVSGCTFDVPGAVGVKSYTGGDWNVTIENCVAKAGTHSLAQLKNVEKGLKVIGCEAYSKNGLGVNNSPSLEMSGCKFSVRGYAVRFGDDENSGDESFTIRNSSLSSLCEGDDNAVIVFRKGALNAKLTLSNTLLAGTPSYLGETNATIIVEAN